jgi:hypothetical protein
MFSSDLLLLLSKGFGQQPKKMDHCEVSSALHPEQNHQQLHGMFVQHLQLLKISFFLWHSEPRFQKGTDLVEI